MVHSAVEAVRLIGEVTGNPSRIVVVSGDIVVISVNESLNDDSSVRRIRGEPSGFSFVIAVGGSEVVIGFIGIIGVVSIGIVVGVVGVVSIGIVVRVVGVVAVVVTIRIISHIFVGVRVVVGIV